MTRHRALTSTLKSVIALLTALVVAVLGASALPAAALAGHAGQAKGHQSDRPGNGGDRSHKSTQQSGKAHKARKATHKSEKPQRSQGADRRNEHASGTRGNEKSSHPGKSGAHGNSAAAHESHGQGDKGDKGDPPGNNGTVKIAPLGENDGTPDNNPHVGCSFQIEWYGFDEGSEIWSTVHFAMQAPTSDVGLSGTSPERVFVGGDPATGAGTETGLDGVQDYTLSFDGAPHPQQGYHVKLTVYTPYSKGADTKHKVFWVEPCEQAAPPVDNSDNPGDSENSENPDDNNGVQDETDDNGVQDETDDNGVQDEVDDNGNTATQVLGVQASTSNSQGAQSQGAASAEVPTAVDSGLTGEQWSRSVLPVLAVLIGLGTTFVALVRRRTRVEAVSRD
jgi:hypothetical protein